MIKQKRALTAQQKLADACESTNHAHSTCYGVLWQCNECLGWFCCNEGTDDGTDLCDTCWAKKEEQS